MNSDANGLRALKCLREAVLAHYLDSRDFNGIRIDQLAETCSLGYRELKEFLTELATEGHVIFEFGDQHPNPYVHAFPTRPIETLLGILASRDIEADLICVYPTPAVLEETLEADCYVDRPFTRRLALGEPQLAFETFDPGLLEFYRNDARYYYSDDDIIGHIGVKDGHSEFLPESDQNVLVRFGYAHDEDGDRTLASFLWDLSKMGPEHQQLWNARKNRGDYQLHPDFARISGGDIPKGVSVFTAFIEEIRLVNECCRAAGRPPMFRDDFTTGDKLVGFGFLLRSSANELREFIQILDKTMSDNLNHSFFKGEVPLTEKVTDREGNSHTRDRRSIALLEDWLTNRVAWKDPSPIEEVIGTFKDVRNGRAKPAHVLQENEYQPGVMEEQRNWMKRAYRSLKVLRLVTCANPLASEVTVPEVLENGSIWLR